MGVFETVEKLIPIRTVPELEGWAAYYRTVPPPNDSITHLKNQLRNRFLDAQCDYIYKTLCPRADMLYRMFFTNALACALLTFSYLTAKEKAKREQAELERAEKEWAEHEKAKSEKPTQEKIKQKETKQEKAENVAKVGVNLSRHYPSRLYASPNVWIKEGLSRYPAQYTSLSQELKQAISIETDRSPEGETKKLQNCYRSLGIFPSEFLLPYFLLPKEVEFKINPENYYYIPDFLSPITTEMVEQLVTDHARLKRDAVGTESIKDRLPPMLEQHIWALFRQVLHWAVIASPHKSENTSADASADTNADTSADASANTISQSKSRLLKTYNCFIQDLLTPPRWTQKNMDFPDQVMLHYVWELLAHPRAIGTLETSLCEIEKRASSPWGYPEDCQHALKLLAQRSAMPFAFWADETILDSSLNLTGFHEYLRAIVADIYICAGRNIDEAVNLTRELILSCKSSYPNFSYPNCSASVISAKSIRGTDDRTTWEVGKVITVLSAFKDHHYFDDNYQIRPAEICTETGNYHILVEVRRNQK